MCRLAVVCLECMLVTHIQGNVTLTLHLDSKLVHFCQLHCYDWNDATNICRASPKKWQRLLGYNCRVKRFFASLIVVPIFQSTWSLHAVSCTLSSAIHTRFNSSNCAPATFLNKDDSVTVCLHWDCDVLPGALRWPQHYKTEFAGFFAFSENETSLWSKEMF